MIVIFGFVGHEVALMFGTASDYVKDTRNSAFGFRCIVSAYESSPSTAVSPMNSWAELLQLI